MPKADIPTAPQQDDPWYQPGQGEARALPTEPATPNYPTLPGDPNYPMPKPGVEMGEPIPNFPDRPLRMPQHDIPDYPLQRISDQPTPAQMAQQASERVRALQTGPIAGAQPHLNSYYNQLGNTRPLGPGEWIRMPDGSSASEETYTTQFRDGRWAVVPGLWLINGVPTHVSGDQAAELAQRSGLNWPMFPSSEAGDAFANQREIIWEQTPTGRTDLQQPLWSRPWPPVYPGGG